MSHHRNEIIFTLSLVLIVVIAAVYTFIAIAIVPYWQTLSGLEIQDWFAGPFVRFAYMMAPVHILSIVITITAFFIHRRTSSPHRILWYVALITLLICQAFNFSVFGFDFNLALQSRELEPDVALVVLDNWDFYHSIRTLSVCISALCMMSILVLSKRETA